jgi:hypothetical protein
VVSRHCCNRLPQGPSMNCDKRIFVLPCPNAHTLLCYGKVGCCICHGRRLNKRASDSGRSECSADDRHCLFLDLLQMLLA